MTFYASHIYREGNAVADNFANIGLSSPTLVWHDSPLLVARTALFLDYASFPGFHFSNQCASRHTRLSHFLILFS